MDETVRALMEIDREAAGILSGIKEEKEALEKENSQRLSEFAENIDSQTRTRISGREKNASDSIESETTTLRKSVDERILKLNELYEKNHDAIAGGIFERVTGAKWEG